MIVDAADQCAVHQQAVGAAGVHRTVTTDNGDMADTRIIAGGNHIAGAAGQLGRAITGGIGDIQVAWQTDDVGGDIQAQAVAVGKTGDRLTGRQPEGPVSQGAEVDDIAIIDEYKGGRQAAIGPGLGISGAGQVIDTAAVARTSSRGRDKIQIPDLSSTWAETEVAGQGGAGKIVQTGIRVQPDPVHDKATSPRDDRAAGKGKECIGGVSQVIGVAELHTGITEIAQITALGNRDDTLGTGQINGGYSAIDIQSISGEIDLAILKVDTHITGIGDADISKGQFAAAACQTNTIATGLINDHVAKADISTAIENGNTIGSGLLDLYITQIQASGDAIQ